MSNLEALALALTLTLTMLVSVFVAYSVGYGQGTIDSQAYFLAQQQGGSDG